MVIDTLVSQISNFQFPISNWEESKNANALYCSTRIRGQKIEFVKPQTMMNESGKAVSSLATFYKLPATDIYVIHDDLDLRLGEYKIQLGVGPKEHRGVLSVEVALGSKDFWRVRVGVDNRNNELGIMNKGKKISGEDYVLNNFSDEELKILIPVINKIIEDLIARLTN